MSDPAPTEPTEPALYGADLFGDPIRPPSRGVLADAFLYPPFSVLNAREGPWQERKRAWRAFCRTRPAIVGEHRVHQISIPGWDESLNASQFDPVLAELMYRWFCPPGGAVLDPFAGEPNKGVVAAVLGYRYTGVEIRPEQVADNRAAWAALAPRLPAAPAPRWVCGDSCRLDALVSPGPYDCVLTSPPYYDLEVYSRSDLSALGSYADFMAAMATIYGHCAGRLADGGMLVTKVGEIRDKRTGAYRGFVPDTVRLLQDLGLVFYNELILLTVAATLAVRVRGQFEPSRKIGKTHQNVLVFVRGDPRALPARWAPYRRLEKRGAVAVDPARKWW